MADTNFEIIPTTNNQIHTKLGCATYSGVAGAKATLINIGANKTIVRMYGGLYGSAGSVGTGFWSGNYENGTCTGYWSLSYDSSTGNVQGAQALTGQAISGWCFAIVEYY